MKSVSMRTDLYSLPLVRYRNYMCFTIFTLDIRTL